MKVEDDIGGCTLLADDLLPWERAKLTEWLRIAEKPGNQTFCNVESPMRGVSMFILISGSPKRLKQFTGLCDMWLEGQGKKERLVSLCHPWDSCGQAVKAAKAPP